jgi:hypothetical protein
VDYQRLSGRLTATHSGNNAAEGHGMLCGLMCGGASATLSLWLAEMLQDCNPHDLLVQELTEELRELATTTLTALEDPDLGFSLLLPDEEQPLPERAAALRNWCQGFLYGLGLTGLDEARLSREIAEALRDLAGIAHLDADGLAGSDDEEGAYAELFEFVRVATMLIRETRVSEEISL